MMGHPCPLYTTTHSLLTEALSHFSAYPVFLALTVHLLRDGATDEDTSLARPVGVQRSNDRAAVSQSDRRLPRGQGDKRSHVDRSVGPQEGIFGISPVHSCDERSTAHRVRHARQDPIRHNRCCAHASRVRWDPTLPFQTISGRNFVGGYARPGSRSTSTAASRSGPIVVLCSRDAVGAGGRAELNLTRQAFIAVES